jgi:tetratricopeptide (TPR) repeat protein
MIDNTENYLDDDALTLVSRFEEMVKAETLYYFDVHEFESIIDHYIEKSNLSEAVKVSNIANKQHPAAISLQIKKAQILVDRGQHLEALAILKKVQSIESTNKEIFLLKGNIYNLLGKHHSAKIQFDQALEIEKTFYLESHWLLNN